MIRGDFVDLTEQELNDLSTHSHYTMDLIREFEAVHGKTNKKNKKEWERFCKDNDARFLEANEKECDWYSSPLYGSRSLRAQAIDAGYRIKSLYPCYHQGWEMDEWGATGTKDGKYYVLETSHGGLCAPHEIEFSKIEKALMTVVKFLGLGD